MSRVRQRVRNSGIEGLGRLKSKMSPMQVRETGGAFLDICLGTQGRRIRKYQVRAKRRLKPAKLIVAVCPNSAINNRIERV